MSHQTPLPFRQGELDGLCGIYAVINAIRLALGTRASLLRPADWHELFVVLLESIDGPIGAAHAASNGIETKPLRSLLRVASLHLVAELDLTVRAAPMFPRNDRPSFAELLQHLEFVSSQPGHAVLLSVFGTLNHWTVVRSVSRTSICLFDSAGYARIARHCCRTTYERPKQRGRQHVVPPDAVFCIRFVR